MMEKQERNILHNNIIHRAKGRNDEKEKRRKCGDNKI